MNGKMALSALGAVVVMALLSFPFAASGARDSQVHHLQAGGGGGGAAAAPAVAAKTPASGGSLGQLACCNRCRQTPWDRWYVCEDRTEMELGCNSGCWSCRCDPSRYPSCQCLDQLYWCPPPCDDDEDVDGTATAAGSMAAEQLMIRA